MVEIRSLGGICLGAKCSYRGCYKLLCFQGEIVKYPKEVSSTHSDYF